MSRIRLTIAVAMMLTASYKLYAQWADGFTREVAKSIPEEKVRAPAAPEAFVEIATQVLPDVAWLRKPGYTFQRNNELFVYAGSAEPARDVASETKDPHAADRIRLAPFVMIWRDPLHPEQAPYVVQCDTARVQFEKPVEFSFDAPSPGRLKAVWFDGSVRITGPDGLLFRGENFDFSEDSLSLFSSDPIEFAYGPASDSKSQVRGSAEGLQITFSQSNDPHPDPGLPRVGGIKRIRLQKSVVLDCQYEERDGKKFRLASAHISCDGALDYNATRREAILLENVLVRRPTGGVERPLEEDALRCHQLALSFIERPESKPEAVAEVAQHPEKQDRSPNLQNPFSGLQVKEVVASSSPRGDRASLQSDQQRLTARMEFLHFDVESGTALLSDRSQKVLVEREATRLESPQIRIAPDEATDKQVLSCLGAGALQHLDDKSREPVLEATWGSQLRAAPDASTGLLLVQLAGDVQLIFSEMTEAKEGSEKTEVTGGLKAEQLNLWIDDASAVSGDESPLLQTSIPGARLADASTKGMPLRYIEATGGVMIASSMLIAETEHLRAEMQSGRLPHSDEDRATAAGGEQLDRQLDDPDADEDRAGADGDEPRTASKRNEPWRMESQSIMLKLLNEPGTREVQVAEATADGAVLLSQAAAANPADPAAKPEPTSLSGGHLQLINEGGAHQFVILTGSPALLSRGNLLLECRNLQLDRAGNQVVVNGEGLLQAPVDQDLNGAELAQPMLLDVKWQSGMTFDGTVAGFRQRVSLQLRDSVLLCDEMDVRLDEPLKFSEPRPDTGKLAIRDVDCRNGVHVEVYDWRDNRIVGIRKAQLTRFLLDYPSGDFRGEGPGKVNHWSYNDGRRAVAIAPRKAAQANIPVSSDGLDWEHICVEFDDLLMGNFKNRTAELHGRVRTIYAPVRRVSETFVRNDLSGVSPSVEHAVWLGCDRMTIELQPLIVADGKGEKRDDLQMTIGADGRCEMEGKLFHAYSDSLSYEEAKQLFTLRGKGEREASVTYQESPGADPHRGSARIIQFIPSEKGQEVKLENSSGIQGTQ